MQGTLRDWKAVVVFVGPALLLYTIILLVPIVWSVGYTFFSGSPITGFKFAGFGNYAPLFQVRSCCSRDWSKFLKRSLRPPASTVLEVGRSRGLSSCH